MTILINCSDSLFGKFIAGRLAGDGSDVMVVGSDDEMKEAVEERDYDLAILVIEHGVADLDVLNYLTSRDVRFFVLSNLNDEESIYSAYQAGAASYMSLPVEFSKLLIKVREFAWQ